MRPVLRPGLRLLHDADRVPMLADRHRVYPVDARTAAVIASLDGMQDEQALEARHPGSARILTRLAARGVIVDVEAPAELARDVPVRRRGAALCEAAALVAHEPDRAEHRWRRRRRATVEVTGQGVLAPAVVRLLTQAGVGTVSQVPQPTASDAEIPAVLTHDHEPPTDLVPPLMRAGRAHLIAGLRGADAVVGPLVRPGRTPCLRCIDLLRHDADRTWGALRDQRSAPDPEPRLPAAPAAGTVTAAAAALAASEVLAEIEGRDPASLGADHALSLGQPVPARREWTWHPSCGCSWHRAMNAPSQWSA